MEDLPALVSGFSLSRARLAAAAGVSEAAIKAHQERTCAFSHRQERHRLESHLQHYAGS